MTNELKPCPFCPDGGKPGLAYRAVKCYQCGVRVDGDTDMDATEKWNTRYKLTCKVDWRDDDWGICECGGDVYDYDIHCSQCGAKVENPKPSCGAEVADV